ncbi:hypothetical protein PN462_13645 [Spirulina sp. CS-785/01]|uniref:hypothetical protein n=1 Tax=Spirulina sp. CS-785/01 TaxID=3021716 RepID=UPI00232D4A1E|nr:hypothetical protein [Spirulina sp. CS-785/01]MDB9314150.1 hypothetical protein [Spirulina sp. CS-785/01]
MNPNDEILNNYLQQLWDVRHNARLSLQQADLEAIALELGLTPPELETLRQYGGKSLTRGQGYLDYERWEDAITELTQAQMIFPLSPDVLYGLAAAYYGRYQAQQRPQDKETATQLAKDCLHQKADYSAALALLNQIDAAPKPWRRRILTWGGVVGGMITIMGLSYALFSQMFYSTQPPTPVTLTSPESLKESSSLVVTDTDEDAIPIRFREANLLLEVPQSRLNVYADAAFYKMQGILVNESQEELAEIEAKVRFLDNQGEMMAEETQMILRRSHAPLRPTDRHAFSLIKAVPPTLAQVEIDFNILEQFPAARAYESSQPLELVWLLDKPQEVNLAVKERTHTQRNYTETVTHQAIWEITNTGEVGLRLVKMQVQFFNQAGEVLEKRDRYLVSSSEPPLLPGETRLLKSILTGLETEFSEYQLAVVEAN